MNEREILFICEGVDDEPDFLRRLIKECYPGLKYRIYSYKTNIHILAGFLHDYYPDFDQGDIDITLVLRDLEKNAEEKKLLSRKFSDIILVFDIELQHTSVDIGIIQKMVSYFNDSSDMGKLYINYPMMQSYKHLNSLPDSEYQYRKCSPSCYKEQVDRDSCIKDIRKYTHEIFARIAAHNMMKTEVLIHGKYILPTVESYLNIDWKRVLSIEYDCYCRTNTLWVLNTISLFIVDYNPTDFIRMVQKHPEKYLM